MYSMKGVLNYQYKTAFIRALQKTYRDERLIAGFYTDLVNREEEYDRRTALKRLAKLADQKKLYIALLLYRLGAAIPLDNQTIRGKFSVWLDAQKDFIFISTRLDRLERSDFGKLVALCDAQRRWV
jgi:hypothetical protein